ncbi:MAG: uracil-DNA glycosylase [Candidatus Omnitrophota bacterium]|nr:uracil-DNA glycosylase [Candidatus Omnitrophota bacterium]
MQNKKKVLVENVKNLVKTEMLSGINEICVPAGNKRKINKSENRITLEEFNKKISTCCNCPLGQTRINFVFGEGSPNAKLMFIGEAPGGDEDKQGRPFVGRAGQLLTKIIEAIGLKREDVFIANIIKCRPPQNRNPLPSEIAACSPYLLKQIELIKPKVICALGKFSAQTLLETETSISRLRGKFYDYHGIKLMPTYHPAYLLRNSSGKKDVWEDMQVIAKELGLKIPG